MPKENFYFKRFDNKIPCGGFYQMGGTIKNKYIESEQFNSMFAKKWGDYLRCICMNLDDYSTITTDINNGIYKTYYDVRFFPIDFLDYLQFMAGEKKLNKWIDEHGIVEEEALLSVMKSLVPFMFGGKPMDKYDVIDLYVNNLGLKSVPKSDNEWITGDTDLILIYYDKSNENFSTLFNASTVIYCLGNKLGDISSGITIQDLTGDIRFVGENEVGYGEYKNVVDFTQK